MKIPFKITLNKEQLFGMIKKDLTDGFDFSNLSVEYESGTETITLSECYIVLEGQIDLGSIKSDSHSGPMSNIFTHRGQSALNEEEA